MSHERSYAAWVQQFDTIGPRERTIARRRLRALRRHPLISVVLPVFNPDRAHFAEAIRSVREQLYENWELCLADDASTDPSIAPAIREYAAADSRIKFTLRESNGHIAACSNSALALATGEWIALLDQDDILPAHALALVAAAINRQPDAGLIYSDEDKLNRDGERCDPFFKPDWNPVLFLGQNFISHLGIYRRDLVRAVGGFREGFEGSQDYDLALRCVAGLRSDQIVHIPRVLYHWRISAGSVAATGEAKPYAVEAARRALVDHLQQEKISGEILPAPENPDWHRVVYRLTEPPPSVSVIIPTRDRLPLLEECLKGLREKTDYPALEIIIVDNESGEEATLQFLEKFGQLPGSKVVRVPGGFNFSRLINEGAKAASKDFLLLLNNDIEVRENGWLREMVGQASQKKVGAVGARLWFRNETLQHAGVLLGVGGVANHAFYGASTQPLTIHQRTFILAQNYSAVTGACLLTRRSIFEDVGGFDENLPVNFNDVDFCLRLRAAGWSIVWTPFADLTHDESASRGRQEVRDLPRLFEQASYVEKKWGHELSRDPFYSPNFSLYGGNFDLAFPPRWENEAALTVPLRGGD